MSRVDVVIPCYKYGHFLRQCVESVLSQEGVEVRVLILDDASPDNTPEVAAALMRDDDRVEYRRHAVNRGHIETYNEGLIQWAEAPYSLLLSADDLLTRGALSRATHLMKLNSEVGMTYGLATILSGGNLPEEPDILVEDYSWQVVSGNVFLEEACSTGLNLVPTPTAVVRTDLQRALGGYRKELPHSGDLEMWLRFAAHASVGIVGVSQAFYRRHNENMTYLYRRQVLGDLPECRDAFESLFRFYGGTMPHGPQLRRLIHRRLAEDAFWRGSRAFDDGNAIECQKCLSFALSTYPDIVLETSWSRFRWKRMVGTRIWQLLHPVLNRLRRIPVSSGPVRDAAESRIIGWWPSPSRAPCDVEIPQRVA